MKKVKLGMIFFLLVGFFAVLVVPAQSDKQVQPKKAKQKAVSVQSQDKVDPVRSPFRGSRQGYLLVTDVLDGFGGESASDNYTIPVNSGGQPSAIGISESDNYGVEAGYVHAIHFKRGDVNVDELIDLGDLLHLISYLYKGGPACCPKEAGDVNCDGVTDLGDILFVISYLYKGGPAPVC